MVLITAMRSTFGFPEFVRLFGDALVVVFVHRVVSNQSQIFGINAGALPRFVSPSPRAF